jgi:hypothetical protein
MDLDRNEISPPKSLMEIIEKMKNGAFDLDLDEIRHDTRVITPPMANIDEEEYGYIFQNFSHFIQYTLVYRRVYILLLCCCCAFNQLVCQWGHLLVLRQTLERSF